MAQIFVSHSSADNPLALRVRGCLGDLGYDSVFLDVSPTDGLVPGTAWRDQLFTNLDRSDALVFLGTPTANASLWCHSELALARWLRKPILSLLFDGVDPHELVADIQGINLASADLSPDLVRPGLVALGLEQAERWDATRSPYPGLRPFDESYAPVFVGRERQIDQLRQLVDPPSRARQGVVVPVLGPSGSGKSSLVRAGLVAALRPAPDWVVSDPWTPSDSPLAELALALAHAAKRHEVALDADECRDLLTTAGGMPEYLRRLREGGNVPAEARVLVVVDQAEELVTLTPEAERRAFLEALALSCTPPSPLRVVMTARTDMWDSVSALTNRFEMTVAPTVLHVPPLSRADLARVIAEPAKRSHLVLDEGLLQRLVEDTESGDALPLLAYTLQRMTTLSQDGQLTHALYDSVGGVRGAIASRAGEVAHGTRSQAEVAAAILHIVGTGENRPVTRLARLDTVPAPQREILDDLVDARLVVIRESAGQQVYAPAHEALFSAWPPLAEMIKHRHDDLRLRSRLERRATDWREGGGGSSGLLSGDELGQAVTWDERNPDLRTPDITAYVDASAARARRSRLVRMATVGVVLALVAALAVVLVVNTRAADRRDRFSDLLGLASLTVDTDPAAAATAALLAHDLDDSSTALDSVAQKLLASPGRDVSRAPGDSPLLVLGLGGDLAITNGNGEQLVWSTATGLLVDRIPLNGTAALRPDGRVAVVVTGGSVTWWDVAEVPAVQLSEAEQSVQALTPKARFSPDGSLLVTTSGPAITLWDVAHPEEPRRLAAWQVDGQDVAALAVQDDGKLLVSSVGATLTEYDPLPGGAPRQVLGPDALGPGQTVNGIVLDQDGQQALLSTTSVAGGSALVDLATGELVRRYTNASDDEGGLTLLSTQWLATMDPVSGLVVAFDLAGRATLFDTGTGDPVGTFGGASGLVTQAAFVDDHQLVTSGVDGAIRIWDVTALSRGEASNPVAELCDAFGTRLTSEDLATLKLDAELPCAALRRSAAAPAPLDLDVPERTPVPEPDPTERVVLTERFDGTTTRLGLGSTTVDQGSLDRRITDGHYEMEVQGQGPGYQTWTMAGIGPGSADFSLAVRLLPGDGKAPCGLTVAGADSRLTAVADPVDGSGLLSWFTSDGGLAPSTFDIPPGDELTLRVAVRGDRLQVWVDENRMATLSGSPLGRPTDVGLVTVGSHTCAFDDFVLASG